MGIFVFDAYGTVFDVHAAIARYRTEAGPDADRLSEIWRTKQLEYTWTLTLAGHYIDFWILTERALDYALARVPSVDKALKAKLMDAYDTCAAYPDALDALKTLKAKGHKLGTLSNGSPKMLANAVKSAGLEDVLEAQISVDAVKMFKTRPEVYKLVTDHYQCAPADVALITSNRWDVMGGTTFGFRCYWINRAKMPDEYPDFPPVAVLSSLKELAASA